jgi:UDP-glucuronate decarboxylase
MVSGTTRGTLTSGRVLDDISEVVTAGCGVESVTGSTVLVTGATGLVGGFLVEVLAAAHQQLGGDPTRIVIASRTPAEARRRFAHIDPRQIEVIDYQFAGPLSINEQIDFVIHGASPATPSAFSKDPIGIYVPNVLGTHFLLELASAHAVSGFLFLSSGATQGAPVDVDGPIDETRYGPIDHLDPSTGYAEAKRMGEVVCASWFRSSGIPVTMARLGHTYGPGLRRVDSRAMAEFVFAAIDGKDIVIHSDGLTRRDYCYMTDATRALFLLLTGGEAGEPYLVVNPAASLTVRELADLLAELAPPPGITVRMEQGARPKDYLPYVQPYRAPDTSKIESLGWVPTILPPEGFRRTLEACGEVSPAG